MTESAADKAARKARQFLEIRGATSRRAAKRPSTMLAAVHAGRVPEARIRESYERIMAEGAPRVAAAAQGLMAAARRSRAAWGRGYLTPRERSPACSG
jgi:hypothetical protein